MENQLIEMHRENAEIYQGHSLCKQKSVELLQEIGLPKGLLPLQDILEVGYNRGSNFVWLKQKKHCSHLFKKIGKQVSYDTEITAFVENRKMKKLSGVKSKEILFWVTIANIFIDDQASDKICFKIPAGASRSFPVSAFEVEDN